MTINKVFGCEIYKCGLIIAISRIVFCIFFVVINSLELLESADYSQGLSAEGACNFNVTYKLINFLNSFLQIISFVACVGLLLGISLRQKAYLVPWLITEAANITLIFTNFVYLLFSVKVWLNSHIVHIVLLLIGAGIETLALLIIFRLYRYINLEKKYGELLTNATEMSNLTVPTRQPLNEEATKL